MFVYYDGLPSSSAGRRDGGSFSRTSVQDQALAQCRRHHDQVCELRRLVRAATCGMVRAQLLEEVSIGEDKIERWERTIRNYPDHLDQLRQHMMRRTPR